VTLETSAVAVAEPLIPPRETSERVRTGLTYTALLAISLLFFVPFLWALSTSFKTLPQTAFFHILPHPWTTKPYSEAWNAFNFALYMRNSAFLAFVITVSNVFLAGLGGYSFARLRFPGREVLFLLVLSTLMIPDQLRLVPVFVMLTNWGLINSFNSYILISLVTAGNLFFMRQYFLTIPKDFEEAAKLDGAGYFKTFWRVMLPLAGPAIAAVTILQFQGVWNDFFWPNLLLQDPSHYVLTTGLAQFVFQYQTNWNDLMAATIIALAPIVLLFVFFQRYFIASVVSAGVKG
jgi:multiple sugar transport system permease protein